MRQVIASMAAWFLLCLTGCSITLNSNVPFAYQPSLPVADTTAYRLGVEKLQDRRPPEDRETTEDIRDVDEKVTVKLMEDLRGSNLFAGVTFPPKAERDDLILSGEVRRFFWKVSMSPIIWIPIFNLAMYFGAPIYDIEAVAQIRLSIVDSKTGRAMGEYTKVAYRENAYSLYSMKAGEAGAELADALRDVVKQLKEAIRSDMMKKDVLRPVP